MEDFVARITKEAGEITKQYFKQEYDVRVKTTVSDVVTDADIASNEYLVAEIKKQFPDHGFITEELGREHSDREWVWVVDPLDGTRNFSRHCPFYCVMVAVTQFGIPQCAAIYVPSFDELYVATRDAGATLNGNPISVQAVESLEHAIGMTDGNSKVTIAKFAKAQEQNAQSYWVHTLGSTGFSSTRVASGQRDWIVCDGNQVWDHAAPACILREVGCNVTNFAGEEWTIKDEHEMVAAHPSLHQQILEILQG